jgi:hypothetical protein
MKLSQPSTAPVRTDNLAISATDAARGITGPLVTALYDGSSEADIRTEVTFEDGRKGKMGAPARKAFEAKLESAKEELVDVEADLASLLADRKLLRRYDKATGRELIVERDQGIEAARLRQDELAGAAGVGLRFIVDLEAGKPTAQIGKTLQVLAALGCSIEITPPPEPKGVRKA